MELLLGGLAVLAASAIALAARARRRRSSGADRAASADVRPHDLDGHAGQNTNQWTFGS